MTTASGEQIKASEAPAVAWLPSALQKRLRAAASAGEATFGDDLVSVLLVGAAAAPNRRDRARSPLVIYVVKEVDEERAAAGLASSFEGELGLRVLCHQELIRSADAEALEIAEWRDRHVLLAGRNPFADLTVDKEHLRLGLEAGFRRLGQRLRNRRIAHRAGVHAPPQAIRSAFERLVVLAHHTLLFFDDPAPNKETELLVAYGKRGGFDTTALLALETQLRSRKAVGERLAALLALGDAVAAGVKLIDEA